jgi:RNA polymerase sigma factor (sigma-70 family)
MTATSGSSVRHPPAEPADWETTVARRLAAQDASALAELYDRYGSFVCGLAARVVGDRVAAEDVTQEVFLHLWRRPDAFDASVGSLRTWLAMLAHRRAVDHVRREHSAHRSNEVTLPRPAADVGEVATSRAVAERVRKAVEDLPPEQQAAVRLAYFGGKTYRQVAVALAIPEGTAKTRLRLALAHMAHDLEREGFSPCT